MYFTTAYILSLFVAHTLAQSYVAQKVCLLAPSLIWVAGQSQKLIISNASNNSCEVSLEFEDRKFLPLRSTSIPSNPACSYGEEFQFFIPRNAPNGPALVSTICTSPDVTLPCFRVHVDGGNPDPTLFHATRSSLRVLSGACVPTAPTFSQSVTTNTASHSWLPHTGSWNLSTTIISVPTGQISNSTRLQNTTCITS